MHVLVVSSTRTVASDESGARIAELVAAAGHTVGDRSVVDDDVNAIRAAVHGRVEGGADVVVLTGGTGITGRDVTPEALDPLLRPRLDGFGELFRRLSYDEIGAAALLSRATAGLVGRVVVFALPGSKKACQLAMEKLVLPELRHLVHLARTDRANAPAVPAPVPQPPEPTPPGPVDVAFEPAPDAPASTPTRQTSVQLAAPGSEAPPAPESEAAWQALVRQWGATVHLDAREPLPEALERLAPAMDVLQRAGRAALLVRGDGRRYSIWGFPDLLRPSSKVLAIGEGGDLGEVLALHRWPHETGTVVPGGTLAALAADPAGAAERATGRRPPGSLGPLFAIASGATWHLAGSRVVRWDGHKERDEGTQKQVLASLLLDWSVR